MAHLIDKDALVAWAKETYLCENASMIRKVCYKQLLEHLDTLEVKGVNTERAVKLLFENNDRMYDEWGNYYYKNANDDYRFYHKIDEDNWDEDRLSLSEVTERLFPVNSIEVKEVDLNVMQRMKECPYRQVGCTMYEGNILECKGACSWVVDYPKLK